MSKYPVVERIELIRNRFPFEDVGRDLTFAVGPFYEPGSAAFRTVLGIKVQTDLAVTGEYFSIAPPPHAATASRPAAATSRNLSRR